MPTSQDEEFVRFAVAGGFLTEDQAKEALAALRGIEELGGSALAPDLVVRRGLLDARQVGMVHQAIAVSKTATKVPRELGGFELLEKIGQGGMGSVFKARQKELDRVVALKVLSPRLARNKEFVERFLREARAAGRLSHPNIVAAIDVGESEGFYYFAMEHVDGETVGQLLAREHRLPEARALAITAEVARALDHAYGKGLIHRDIKPDNMMVTRDGRVRVTDFGLAKALGGDDPSANDSERFLGTPAYVAPEQIRSEPDIDCRADIFSLGVTLFQMLTGELPFKGAHAMAVAASVMADPLPSLRKLCPDLSPAATRVVERMTAKKREERYGTPSELIAAIESALAAPQGFPRAVARAAPGRSPARGAPRAAPRRRGAPVGAIMAIVAILILFGILVLVVMSSKRRPGEQGGAVPSTETGGEKPTVAPPQTSPPAEAAGQELVERLSKAVAEAQDFARRNPAAYGERIARFRKTLDEFPLAARRDLPAAGLDLIQQAEAGLKQAEGQRLDAAEADLKERNTRADGLLKSGKISEALRLFDTVPAELRIEATSAKVERLRAHYRQTAVTEFQAMDVKGRQLLREARLEEAKALYVGAKAWDLPEVTERCTEALTAIEGLLAKRGVLSEKEAAAAYRQTAQAVLDQLAARDYAAARKLADAAIVEPKLLSVREKLRGLQALARVAAEVWTRVAIGAKNLKPGQPIHVGGLGGEFARFESEKIYVKSGDVLAARPLTDLKTGEAIALASEGAPSPQLDAKLALFMLADRDYGSGRARLDSAKAKGADVAEELSLFERFAPRPCATCQGAKAVPCAACDGKGYSAIERTECDACRGKGRLLCSRCHGRGRLRCANCGGSGRSGLGLPCAECGGRGMVDCAHCRNGLVACKKCKGEGFVTTTTPCETCKGKKTVPCPACGGRGLLPPADLAAAETAPQPPPDRPQDKPAPKLPKEPPPKPPGPPPKGGAPAQPVDMP